MRWQLSNFAVTHTHTHIVSHKKYCNLGSTTRELILMHYRVFSPSCCISVRVVLNRIPCYELYHSKHAALQISRNPLFPAQHRLHSFPLLEPVPSFPALGTGYMILLPVLIGSWWYLHIFCNWPDVMTCVTISRGCQAAVTRFKMFLIN